MPLEGGQGPEFGSSVNPITTRGADYAHHITASPPGFENPAASLPTDLADYAHLISTAWTPTDFWTVLCFWCLIVTFKVNFHCQKSKQSLLIFSNWIEFVKENNSENLSYRLLYLKGCVKLS